jgi:Glycosyl hydrolase family 81 C-terminal domain
LGVEDVGFVAVILCDGLCLIIFLFVAQNAFYNDMHFHYGYFIFSAAVVSHFDPEWGRQMFERVLLLIRCIANPSDEDEFFPTWRHKDWFQGHSWASGIAVVFLNGKNQESSSESIAAYEAIALYGNTMVSAWEKAGAHSEARIAREIEQAGQLLTATELRSARAYWHVSDDEEVKIYPSSYTPKTIGILWQTMAQCQTWFGAAAYLAYGIQLLPLTPISEFRDTLSWSKGMYHIFSESCGSDPGCTTNGWSVLQIALLAVVGYQQDGAEIATALPADVFESAGGNGHSLTNTLWYVSTRPFVDIPLELTKAETKATKQAKSTNKNATQVKNCGKPGICTDYVLDTIAGEYTCRQRMDWLVQQMGQSEKEACIEIAGVENPYECGACNPEGDDGETSNQVAPKCSQCTLEQCQSDLNRCPLYEATFVCTQGGSLGGCSRTPWNVPSQQCEECCELTHCTKVSASEERAHNEDRCPPCSRHECRESMNQCRPSNGVLFLCQKGPSEGGCSLLPWDVGGFQCSKCCSVSRDCGK